MLRYPNGFDSLPLLVVSDKTRIWRLIQILLVLVLIMEVAVLVRADVPLFLPAILGCMEILIIITIEVVIRLFGPRWRKVYTIDSSTVMCQTQEETWTENMKDYQDVHWFTETRGSGKNRNTYQVVELRHGKNQARTVRLVDSQRQAGVRAKWESAAKLATLPATKDLGGGKILRREAEDLDLSIRQLVEKGVLVDDFDAGREVPGGVQWRQTAGRLEVRIRRATPVYLLAMAVIGIFGGFITVTSEGEPLVVIGLLVALGVVAVIGALHKYLLVIEGPNLYLSGRLMDIPYWPAGQLGLEEIETVLTGNPKSVFSMVRLEADRRTISFGPVSAKAGQWLEKFLISAIANAPRS